MTVMNGGSLQVVGPAFNGDPSDQLMQQLMHAFTPVQASTSLPKLEKTIERVTGTKNKSAATEDKSAAPVIKHRAMQARANRSIEL